MGSKSRIAKQIVPIIQSYIDKNKSDKYYEPFVGGANIIDKIKSNHKYASDLNPYLIELLCHVQSGGELYDVVSRDLYNEAREAFNSNDVSKFQMWQIGNIGFLASYNGRWFDGGYAKPVVEKTKNGERYRDYYREGKDNLLKQAPLLKNIVFKTLDYRNANPKGFVIYCDPPYCGVKEYKNSTYFDYEKFWQIMNDWSVNNIVLVSELSAPNNWTSIWKQTVSRSIKVNDKRKAVEQLFIHNKYID